MVLDVETERRNKFERRIYRMLIRSGFGDIIRTDGSVIRRKMGDDFQNMVDFAMRNRLDRERSSEIYRLYAIYKHNTIIKNINSQ